MGDYGSVGVSISECVESINRLSRGADVETTEREVQLLLSAMVNPPTIDVESAARCMRRVISQLEIESGCGRWIVTIGSGDDA